MCANVALKLCANDIHFCAQMKTAQTKFSENVRKCNSTVLKSPVFLFIMNLSKLKYPYEPVREKTNNLGSNQVRYKTSLYSHRRWLEAGNFGFRK